MLSPPQGAWLNSPDRPQNDRLQFHGCSLSLSLSSREASRPHSGQVACSCSAAPLSAVLFALCSFCLLPSDHRRADLDTAVVAGFFLVVDLLVDAYIDCLPEQELEVGPERGSVPHFRRHDVRELVDGHVRHDVFVHERPVRLADAHDDPLALVDAVGRVAALHTALRHRIGVEFLGQAHHVGVVAAVLGESVPDQGRQVLVQAGKPVRRLLAVGHFPNQVVVAIDLAGHVLDLAVIPSYVHEDDEPHYAKNEHIRERHIVILSVHRPHVLFVVVSVLYVCARESGERKNNKKHLLDYIIIILYYSYFFFYWRHYYFSIILVLLLLF